MHQSRTQSRWQRAVDAQNTDTSADASQQNYLAKPDAAAAELSESLQTITANSLFTRIALITTKWVIRPLIWLPIKYGAKLVWWSLRNTKVPDNDERRRRNELWGQE